MIIYPPESITDLQYLHCSFSAITDLSCLRHIFMSIVHLDFGIFFYFSMQIFSNSAKLHGEHWWTAILRSCHRFSCLGFDLAILFKRVLKKILSAQEKLKERAVNTYQFRIFIFKQFWVYLNNVIYNKR